MSDCGFKEVVVLVKFCKIGQGYFRTALHRCSEGKRFLSALRDVLIG